LTLAHKPHTFAELGVAPRLLEALAHLRFTTPTPIQVQAIPPAVEGKDVIGVAQTGTGKTLAFGLPLIQRLAQQKGTALVVLPTRELAAQVERALLSVGKALGLRTAVLIGGASMHLQHTALARKPHVIIATPGRLIDHLEQKTADLRDARILVLDEADRMFDMGFAPQLKKIFVALPKPEDRQTLLFSATIPDQVMNLARQHMRLPIRIEIAPSGTAAETVEQEVFIVAKQDKTRLLEKILGDTNGSVLVFMRTKHTAKRLTRGLRAMGNTAAELHSNRSVSQRREALEGFSTGRYRVLVATDLAARGIDVRGIALVINYDLPMHAEDYVHRIGRTGRAGEPGRAISFVMPDQRRELKAIERLIRTALRVSTMPQLPAPQPKAIFAAAKDDRRPYRSFSSRGRGPHSRSRSRRGR
jgi:ATP-dependent RNA helicase RhlE